MDLERRGPIDARPGETIEIAAPGEGIGGFLWHAEVPHHAATIVGETLGPPSDGVGAGTAKVFRVRLEGPGDTTLRLVQTRSWDSVPGRVIEVPIRCVSGR
ncbi:protease inhibitor I42 family protein [Methylobacterium sp. Leaf108]|uniref:protease inhibitor I42 family protein n=1 Tax=unclassified Methylobacterium TaxID=2615210 RepID=UPI0009EAAD88|nr:protease inhibitor I42 family protein [Methylobacterium sp. Leaf108]